MTDRQTIIDSLLESGLAEKCLNYQTIKAPKYYVEELRQELWVWLMTYDLEKLSDAYENSHLNALITRWLQNQFHSKNSPFYRVYRKWDERSVELTDRQNEIADEQQD